MSGQRSPRFRRVEPPAFELTDRDLELVRAVARYGFLKSTHIDRLFPAASRQNIRRRLRTLYHAGYLERPKAQVVTMLMGLGTHHYIYTLAPKGAALLASVDQVTVRPKSTDAKLPNLLHAVAVSDFLVSVEIGCRELADEGLTFLPFARILKDGPPKTRTDPTPWRWPVEIRYTGTSLTSHVQPDAIFGLALPDAAKLCMLEVDNGTMPVVRRTPYQTSLLRKLLAYAKTHQAGMHTARFGIDSLRILFVVPSADRADELRRVIRELIIGSALHASPHLFLVIDKPTLYSAEDGFLLAKWRDAEGNERLLFE